MRINWSNLFSEVYPSGGDVVITRNTTLGNIVSALLDYIFPIAGLLLLLYLLFGGFQFLTSGGDPKKAQSAQSVITTAFTGFIIVFVSYWIVQFAGIALGLSDITNVVEDRGTCRCDIYGTVITDNCNAAEGYTPHCLPGGDPACQCQQ